jgi:hypothetical protein
MYGAIRVKTGCYELPEVAMKKEDYTCTLCRRTVFLRRGEINVPHFAHKHEGDPCKYYDRSNSGESSAHQTGKLILKNILDTKRDFKVIRTCRRCDGKHIHQIPMDYTEIKLEGRVSKGFADVLVVYADKDIAFEVYHTHATDHRDGEWYELTTKEISTKYSNEGPIEMTCMRQWRCESCEAKIKKENEDYLIRRNNEIRIQQEQKEKEYREWRERKERDDAFRRQKEEEQKEQDRIRHEDFLKREAESQARMVIQRQKEEEERKKTDEQRKLEARLLYEAKVRKRLCIGRTHYDGTPRPLPRPYLDPFLPKMGY